MPEVAGHAIIIGVIGYVMVAVVAFAAGCACWSLVVRVRRQILPAVQESVTAFGEELQALTFDPLGPTSNPVTLKEYRLALDSYDRAASARTRAATVAALWEGRSALIRLQARIDGRPVPIDALPGPEAVENTATLPGKPEEETGERFLTTGRGPGTTEFLIDRPEPGRLALVELVAEGDGNLFVSPVVRTEDETRVNGHSVLDHSPYRGRRPLRPWVTHLRVETTERGQRWSARVRPITSAPPLGSEWRGECDEVLFYDGGPALLTVQIKTKEFWNVTFVCGCLRDRDCTCRPPRWHAGTPGSNYDHSVSGTHDGMQTLRLPRRGYLILRCRDRSEWYLSTRPVIEDPEPDPHPQQRGRRGRRR
ncbi:hypothetical protein NE236_06230 [Actinoallomurus purpureus]|uniref:hypothetical protein n=1 Tax=Actinoallomurus purpureus TaxID=478114 RepID=UPI0020933E2E|nr:hypothetical protein [Actinoallomurus purpureus]MCO6004572.1 hypothetical protein [Actinoallomurus purpureus]